MKKSFTPLTKEIFSNLDKAVIHLDKAQDSLENAHMFMFAKTACSHTPVERAELQITMNRLENLIKKCKRSFSTLKNY